MLVSEDDAIFFTDPLQVDFLQSKIGTELDRCWKIPLSLYVYGFLIRRRFEHVKPYIDSVDYEDCERWYLEEGLRHSRDWLRELDLGFEVEGIDIAALDAPCQFLLFSHLRFIEKTTERIVETMPGIKCFHVVQNANPLEHEFYFESDVFAGVIGAVCERLSRGFNIIKMEQRPAYVFPQARPFLSADASQRDRFVGSANVNGIGFAPATVANAESIVDSLRAAGLAMAIFPSNWPGPTFDRDNEWRLSAADGDWSEQLTVDLNKLYNSFCERRTRSTLPAAIVRNPRLDFQFSYIIQHRWRGYANMIHRARELVQHLPLSLFIHSDHFTAEGAILSRLYRRSGTKILISLHSDYPCDRNWASWDGSDNAMVPTKSAAARLRELSGISRIFRTGDPMARAYGSLRQASIKRPPGELKQSIAGGRKILLVLANALELNCVPFVDLEAHFHSMSVVATIAESLKDRVATALRTKPGLFGEDPMLYQQLSGFSPDIHMTNEIATFSDCLKLADCVVGVNVATGGYYQILRNGPPLIHFQGARVVSNLPDLDSEAMIKITDPEMLGPAIEAVLFDMDHRESALRKQRAFAASDFELSEATSRDPVASVVQRVIKVKPYREFWLRWFGKETKPNRLHGTPREFSSMRISSSAGGGYVDDVLFTSSGLGLAKGWAADLDAKQTAKAVHLFLNDRWVGGGAPSIERPDVVAVYGIPELLRAGFSIAFRWDKDIGVIDALKLYAEMHDGGFHQLSRSF